MLDNHRVLKLRSFSALFFSLAFLMPANAARAVDFTAVSAAGTWSGSAAWTPVGVPGASDTAYIGRGAISGASSTATIALSQNENAYNVVLGANAGDGGTLDLGNFVLSVSNYLILGNSPGVSSAIVRGSGSLTAARLYVGNANSFAFGASDAAGYLETYNGASVTTSSSGNVTVAMYLHDGGEVDVGADTLLSDRLDLRDAGSTLNMNGHKLTANNFIFLGWYDSGVPSLINRGPLATTNLYVANQPFSLLDADNVTNLNLANINGCSLGSHALSSLYLGNSSLSGTPAAWIAANLELDAGSPLTTASTGNVTSSAYVHNGGALKLGVDMILGNGFDLRDSGSTFDMGGHKLSARNYIFLGWYDNGVPKLVNRGPLATTNLYVANQSFGLISDDAVSNMYLAGVNGCTLANRSLNYLYLNNTVLATAGTWSTAGLELAGVTPLSTSTTANVTSTVHVHNGSVLTLGADMLLDNLFDLHDSGSTLDMGGHKLSAANYIFLGWYNSGVPTLVNRGPLSTANLYVANQPFSLSPSDSVTNWTISNVNGGTLTNNCLSYVELANGSQLLTSVTGNITGSAYVHGGSLLTLGADLLLSGNLDLRDAGSTLDMAGHKLSANVVYLGWNNGTSVAVARPGSVNISDLYVGGASAVILSAPTSTVDHSINLSNDAKLTLQQPDGQVTGMTFLGSSSNLLSANNSSVLNLSAGSAGGLGWLLRWQDPSAGTWETTLQGMIAAGRIAVSSTGGYSVFDEGGYTYVATPSTVFWNGGGTDNNWSTAANWIGTSPNAGRFLRFGPLASRGHTANVNDLAPHTLFSGIFFDTAAPGYNLQGNPIQLSGFVVNQSANDQTISVDIQLVPGSSAFDGATFETDGMTIIDSGSISGAGMQLSKTGVGTLVLAGTNSYSGGTEVLAGELVATSTDAILDGTDLIVGANAAIAFAAPVVPAVGAASALSPVPEPNALTLLTAALGVAAVIRSRAYTDRT
jgi:fibronectin-binding autotransporter adhesin